MEDEVYITYGRDGQTSPSYCQTDRLFKESLERDGIGSGPDGKDD